MRPPRLRLKANHDAARFGVAALIGWRAGAPGAGATSKGFALEVVSRGRG